MIGARNGKGSPVSHLAILIDQVGDLRDEDIEGEQPVLFQVPANRRQSGQLLFYRHQVKEGAVGDDDQRNPPSQVEAAHIPFHPANPVG